MKNLLLVYIVSGQYVRTVDYLNCEMAPDMLCGIVENL